LGWNPPILFEGFVATFEEFAETFKGCVIKFKGFVATGKGRGSTFKVFVETGKGCGEIFKRCAMTFKGRVATGKGFVVIFKGCRPIFKGKRRIGAGHHRPQDGRRFFYGMADAGKLMPSNPLKASGRSSEREEFGKQTMRANLGILRDFYEYNPEHLVTFGINIATNLDPVIFPNLPVSPATLKTLTTTLADKQAATITGGRPAFAARDIAFDALAAALDTDADYVETVVKGNMEMLLGTGYLPVNTNRAASPLDDTAILGLYNNGTTQVLLRLQPVVNAKVYQVQISADGGKTWLEAGLPTKAQRIVIPNLLPGTTYLVRARAIGGSTGASAWTAPGTIMST